MPKSFADDLIEIVERSFEELRRFNDAGAASRPSADRWSPKQILGHLLDSAVNNHQRFVRAQAAPEISFPAYEPEFWVEVQGYQECSWIELMQVWGHYNLQLARVIRRIPDDKLENVCHIGDNAPVNLEFLIEDYLVHLKDHLRQIELCKTDEG
jgi:hypothetical protein